MKNHLKTLRRVLPLLILVGAILALNMSGAAEGITLEQLQSGGESLRQTIAAHPVLTSIGFFVFYAAVIILCLPVASFIILASGFLFGTVWGGGLNILGGVLGSACLFLVARSSFGGFLRDRVRGPAEKIAVQMEKNAVSYLLFLRLVPAFPAIVTSVVPALFRIPFGTFLWTAALGMAPVAVIYAYLGQRLGEVERLRDLFSPGLAVALLVLGLLALLPVLKDKFSKKDDIHP
jgi:uncharacterized membrane protein YdjX (TVP38/TMEM64 family)